MWKRLGLGLALGLWLGLGSASAQSPAKICYEVPGTPYSSCQPVQMGLPWPQRWGQYGAGSTAPVYCQITSLATAKTLISGNCSTGSILANATIVQICVSGAPIRYTSSGVVTPTASVGMPVAIGTCFSYTGPLSTLTLIQQSASATLDIETFP